jgi:hypothetical protein
MFQRLRGVKWRGRTTDKLTAFLLAFEVVSRLHCVGRTTRHRGSHTVGQLDDLTIVDAFVEPFMPLFIIGVNVECYTLGVLLL